MTLSVTATAPAGGVIAILARREAARIMRHPAFAVLLLYFAVQIPLQLAGQALSPRDAVRFAAIQLGLLWFGPATFFAANMVASSARRAHAESQLAAAPTDPPTRTLATCLGVLGPTVAASGLAAILWLIEHSGPTLDRTSLAELAVIPLCTLGGGLLGVAVAVWLPWRGVPALVLLTLLAWVVAVFIARGDWWWTAPWSVSPAYWQEYGMGAGSHAWHAIYLLGLSLLAAVAALLRYPSHRRPLLALGIVLSIGTAGAAWAQLP